MEGCMSGNFNSGRRPIQQDQKELFFQKMVPYLQSGLTVNSACLQTGISKSTIYRLMNSDTIFRERIEASRNYLSILVSRAMVRELHRIAEKQQLRLERVGEGNVVNREYELTPHELGFLKWFAMHSSSTREEFSNNRDNLDVLDPSEIIRQINEVIDGLTDE